MDYGKIKEAAQNYQEDMVKFLRAIVKNPGESCDPVIRFSLLMPISIRLVSVTSKTGTSIHTKVTKQKKKSVDVVSLTSAVVSYLLYTVPES